MKSNSLQVIPKPALPEDLSRLAGFLNAAPYVHRHLDWRGPLEWLGRSPYWLAEQGGEVVGALACPPDPEEIAWIRLFGSNVDISPLEIWSLLLPQAISMLEKTGRNLLAAINLQDWFEPILKQTGFSSRQSIILLEWEGFLPPKRPIPADVLIRPMLLEDLPVVQAVDAKSFAPLWVTSLESLQLAYYQSSYCTVAEDEGGIIGYQISSQTPLAAHLARLAVIPARQGKNIGYNLVYDLLEYFMQERTWRVTVNTQDDNHTSLALYARLGFHRTGEEFPVYSREVPAGL